MARRAWTLSVMALVASLWLSPSAVFGIASYSPPYVGGGEAFVVATQPFTAVLGSVNPCQAASDYAVTLDWGDGQTSPGTLALDPMHSAECTISGSYTYAQVEPDYHVYTVTITATSHRQAEFGSSFSATGYVNVSRWTIGNVKPLKSLTRGVTWTIFTFPDSDASGPYDATIDWGDGTSSSGPVDRGWVKGAHSYPRPGVYAVTARVFRGGAEQAAVTTRAVISNCGAVPLSAATPFTPPRGSANARWLAAAYHDLLGRSIDPASLAAWGRALSLGASRASVALAMQRTPDYRTQLVDYDYSFLLGRSPTDSELAGLGSHTDESILTAITTGAEYRQMIQDPDIRGLVSTVYCDLLHRPATDADRSADLGLTAQAIAAQVLGSDEYRRLVVEAAFLRSLRRTPRTGESDRLIRLLARGGSDEDVEAALLGSRQYFAMVNNGGTFAGSPSVASSGRIVATLRRPATLALVVLRSPGERVGSVSLGRFGRGTRTIDWNREVAGRALPQGKYLLLVEARRGATVVDSSDPIRFVGR